MKDAKEWLNRFKERTDEVSDTTLWSIAVYIAEGYQPGSFVTCLLANDLRGAVSYADANNRYYLPELVSLLANELPSNAWGSYEKVWSYIDAKRKELESETKE